MKRKKMTKNFECPGGSNKMDSGCRVLRLNKGIEWDKIWSHASSKKIIIRQKELSQWVNEWMNGGNS